VHWLHSPIARRSLSPVSATRRLSSPPCAKRAWRSILMTEKDAVKCAPGFAGPDAWYVELVLEPRATQAFFLLAEIRTRLEAAPVME
jgi:tetraacyldisaccharide-1-P 4'-kinase